MNSLNLTPNKSTSKSPITNRRTRDTSATLEPTQVSADQSSLTFTQFKIALFEATRAIYQNFNPYESCIMMVKEKILPLYGVGADLRSVQNIKLQEMLLKLEDDLVIELLTDLHSAIHKVYEYYSDHKGHMTFDRFMKFCTDFQVFPDILSKAEANRIFLNLSFIVTEPANFNERGSILLASPQAKKHTPRESGDLQGMKQSQMIDQHLFIEGLALCALHIDTSNYPTVLPQEKEPIEKILMLIEKISSSEGGSKMKGKKNQPGVQMMQVQKVDLMPYFRKKYKDYFELKKEA